MKNKLLLSSLLSLTLLMTSCGGSKNTSPSSTSESTSTTSSDPSPTSESSESTITPVDGEYVVSFDTLGGPTYKSLLYKGDSLKLPTPQYYHHQFLGWYEDSTYSGDAVSMDAYIPTGDITLFAKWKEVFYVYMYYGSSTDHERYEVEPGASFNIDNAFTPESCEFSEVLCPFTHWSYEYTYEVASGIIEVNDDVILVAQYDKSNVVGKQKFTEIAPGVYESRGNAAKIFYEGYDKAYFEMDVSCAKGASGGCGILSHGMTGKQDYVHEAGCYYLSCVFVPANGEVDIQVISDGYKGRLTAVYLTSMPQSFQNRFNSLATGGEFTFHMAVQTTAYSFSLMIDNVVVYTLSDISSAVSKWTGFDYASLNGVGIRSTTAGAIFSNLKYNAKAKNITLDFKGEATNVSYSYLGGNLPTYKLSTPNYCADEFSFDQEGNDVFDSSKADRLEDGMTLYMSHKRAYSHPGLSSLGNNRYVATSNLAGLIGIAEKTDFAIEMNINLIKKSSSGGAIGAIIGATFTDDNAFETGATYIMLQVAGTGGLQVASNTNGAFEHISGAANIVGSKSLASMPASFRNPYNEANEGDAIPVKLTVNVSTSKVELLINDTLMCTIINSALIAMFKGNGYGVRANNAQLNSEFSYIVK